MTPRPLLYVLIGPPGAGKSTYARQAFPRDWIVCADDVRESMTKWRRDDPVATWKYVAPMQAEIQKALVRRLRERLATRLPTVYDNTNLTRRNRDKLVRLAPEDTNVRYVVLDRPLQAKIAERGWRPERLIREQQKVFEAELPAILAGDGLPNVTVEDRRT